MATPKATSGTQAIVNIGARVAGVDPNAQPAAAPEEKVGARKPAPAPAKAPAKKAPARKAPAKKAAAPPRRPAASTPAPAAPPPPPSAPSADADSIVKQSYGYLSWALDDPQLGPILRQAATEGWDDARIKGAVQATDWWKTHASNARTWQQLNAEDPATAQRQRQEMQANIASTASHLGVSIAPSRIAHLSEDALRLGWSTTELQSAIGAEYHYDPNAPTSAVAVNKLKALAGNYLVPQSDASLESWAKRIISGQESEESYTAYLVGQAKSRFPSLAAGLDNGDTVVHLADAYKETAAQLLELNPATINLSDDKWMRPFTQIDPKTNAPALMSLSDWQSTLRTDPTYGFDKTTGAVRQATALGDNIDQLFGRTG